MPTYSIDELDDLEEQSANSGPLEQVPALTIVSALLERNGITYGVMGGMNFYLRGSGRFTTDIDIAVDNRPRMDTLLTIFDGHPDIYRPANKMQWVSGVARLFVMVEGGRRLVQVDLLPKGSEGTLIPQNLAQAVETLRTTSVECQGLTIGPLVRTKIKAHYGRETLDDYRDLRFVCTSPNYSPLVRQAASTFRLEWKECFLEKIINQEPQFEGQVRYALNMDRSPSPQNKGKGNSTDSRGGGNNGRGGGGGGGGPSRGNSPRDGDKSADKYYTYSAREGNWYHRHSDGSVSWAKKSNTTSQSAKTYSQTKPRESEYKNSSTSRSSAPEPKDGALSSDRYWTYSRRDKRWRHRHSDGTYSYR